MATASLAGKSGKSALVPSSREAVGVTGGVGSVESDSTGGPLRGGVEGTGETKYEDCDGGRKRLAREEGEEEYEDDDDLKPKFLRKRKRS